MKTSFLRSAIIMALAGLFGGVSGAAETSGRATFNVTSYNYANTSYDPRNVNAIWVETGAGVFVRTLEKMANTRQPYLYRWLAASKTNTLDAITGATMSSHATHTVVWDGRDAARRMVADGVYRIRAEITMANGQGPCLTNWCVFTKGVTTASTNYPDSLGFQAMSLTWEPATADVGILSVSATTPVPLGLVCPVTVRLTNYTAAAVADVSVTLGNAAGGAVLDAQSVALAAYGGALVTLNWDTAGAAAGSMPLRVLAGPLAGETYTNDNVAVTNVLAILDTHDVGVSQLAGPSFVVSGATATVTAWVTNAGGYSESFTVGLRDLTDNVAIGGLSNVNAMALNTQRGVGFQWNTTGRSAGSHTLQATVSTVAGETNLANNTASAPVVLALGLETNTYVTLQSRWKYHDRGRSLHGAPWNALSFYDGEWIEAPAPLGYGGNGEVTTLAYGGVTTNRYPCYYFRRLFVADAAPIALTARVQRDDGVAVFINGVEALRDGLPAGPPAYATFANQTVNGASETNYFSFTLDPNLIKVGWNVVAAELHQVNASSSDINFDFELKGVGYQQSRTHDLAVTAVRAPARVQTGDTVPVAVRVANKGTAAERAVVSLQDTASGYVIGTQTVAILAPQEFSELPFAWGTTGVTVGAHALRAEVAAAAGETMVADNVATASVWVEAFVALPATNPAAGALGGYGSAVAVRDTVCYVGEGATLSAWDVANPAAPVRVGWTVLPGRIEALACTATHLYAACGQAGLFVVRASPLALVGAVETSGHARGLAINGSWLAVADGPSGVRFLDVSVPEVPVLRSVWQTGGPAVGVTADGDAFLVLDYHNGVAALDLSNPVAPVRSWLLDAAFGQAMAMAASRRLWVADGDGLLTAYQATGGVPARLGAVRLPAPAERLTIAGSTVLAAAGGAGLVVVDGANPAAPGILGTLAFDAAAHDLALVTPTVVAVAADQAGLVLATTTSPAVPAVIARVGSGLRARDAVVRRSTLYVAAGDGGLRVFTLSDVASPQDVASRPSGGPAGGVAVDGDLAVVACGTLGAAIYSIADATNPIWQATWSNAALGAVREVALWGREALVSDGRQVQQVNLADATAPVLRGSYTSDGFIHGLALADGRLCLAAGSAGLLMSDLTLPAGLGVVVTSATPGVATAVAVANGAAYVCAGQTNWLVYDVSALPPLLQTTRTYPQTIRTTAVAGGYAWGGFGSSGLVAMDAGVPLLPVEAANYTPLAAVLRLRASGALALGSGDNLGLVVIDRVPDDHDLDGLSDALERQIIAADPGDALVVIEDVAPEGDFDGDGFSNAQEQIAGSDATDRLSFFAVAAVAPDPVAGFTVAWRSVDGRSYTVRRAEDMAGEFIPVATGIVGQAPLNTWTDTNALPRAYYMVTVE